MCFCVGQRAYFDLIRLNKHERVVRILSGEGAELVRGELGTLIGRGEKAYACLARDEKKDGSVCLEWMHKARLHLHYERHEKVPRPSSQRRDIPHCIPAYLTYMNVILMLMPLVGINNCQEISSIRFGAEAKRGLWLVNLI